MQVVDDLLRPFKAERRDDDLPSSLGGPDDHLLQVVFREADFLVPKVAIGTLADESIDRLHGDRITDDGELAATEVCTEPDMTHSRSDG